MLSFARRTVIITGAGGSIARPLSFAFAKAGANVVVNDYGCTKEGEDASSNVAENVASEITALGHVAVADAHDIATEADKIVATAVERFGRVDVIVNNAGIAIHGPVEEQTPAIARRVFEVNALGAMALCHYAWPHMQRQKYGRIVNFSSDSIYGIPLHASYALSRGAILGLTRSLAIEGAPHHILVNSIGPVAISRMNKDILQYLPPEQQVKIQDLYTGESNVPPILALASEENTHTGQIWSTGGYALGRTLLGTVKEEKDLQTPKDCLGAMSRLLSESNRWIEPASVEEFMAYRQ